MKSLLASLVLVVGLLVAFLPAPAGAQTAPIPALSLQRLSLGLTAEYVVYSPATALVGLKRSGEVKVALPVAYNLGRFSSLQGKVRFGIDSKAWEYSGGITFHILARGSRP